MSVNERVRTMVADGAMKNTADVWPSVALADAPLEIIDGDRGKNYPKQHEFLGNGHCLFLNAGNVTIDGFNVSSCSFISSDRDQRLGKGKITLHDTVLTTRGTIGNSAYFNETVPFQHIRIDSGMVILRPSMVELDPRFLYLVTRSPQFRSQVQSLSTGSAQPQLPIRDIEEINIPLPPLPEQRATAHVLGTLDDKIELNRRMSQTLEEMARALFKSWFVDFDPVRAKAALKQHALGDHFPLAGEPSGNAAAPTGEWTVARARAYLGAMDPQIAGLFPDRLVDSELGEIPEGWKVRPLGALVELNPREPLKRGTIALYLDMAALPTSGPCPDEAVLRQFKSGTRFRNRDTLFARITPCLENGKTAFVQSLPPGMAGWGSTEFIVMRAISPVPPEYTYLLARDPAFRAYAIQSMTGTSGRQRARNEVLANYMFSSPSDEVWTAFGLMAENVFDIIESLREESRPLREQRDALLPKLVSGKARVGQ